MNLPEAVAGQIDVSRETMDMLAAYVALVEKWQQRVNLVSASTLPDIWMRHIWDSAQLVPGTRGLFLKGARAEAELVALDTRSDITRRLHPSLTNPEAFVVDLTVSP